MRIKLSIPFRLSDFNIRGISDRISDISVLSNQITHICTDSRMAMQNDLFIALKGSRFNGNLFIGDAIRKGCVTIGEIGYGAHIETSDIESTLLGIAKEYLSLFRNLKSIIAITGSVGKSSTKEFLKKIIGHKYNVHANHGNFNNFIGLSHTIFSMPHDTEYLIAELGMNHRYEISKMSKCISANIGIITNIGTAHIGHLGSRYEIAEAKKEICDGISDGIILIPPSEPLLSSISNSHTVGLNTSLSKFSLCENEDGSFSYTSPYGRIDALSIHISSEHMQKNISIAIAACLNLNLSIEDIRNGILMISESDLRQRFIHLDNFSIFDDSYNASAESVLADLQFMKKSYSNRPLGVFLGDIEETGDKSIGIQTELGKSIAGYGISSFYLIGRYAEVTAAGAIAMGFNPERIFINSNSDNKNLSIAQIEQNHLPSEMILFKASHKHRLDLIADEIAKRKETQ